MCSTAHEHDRLLHYTSYLSLARIEYLQISCPNWIFLCLYNVQLSVIVIFSYSVTATAYDNHCLLTVLYIFP